MHVELSEEALAGPLEGMVPGKFLVEYLSFLRHIPPWLPGATSQRQWAKWMTAADKLKNVPFEHARSLMVRHAAICVRKCSAQILHSQRVSSNMGDLNR